MSDTAEKRLEKNLLFHEPVEDQHLDRVDVVDEAMDGVADHRPPRRDIERIREEKISRKQIWMTLRRKRGNIKTSESHNSLRMLGSSAKFMH